MLTQFTNISRMVIVRLNPEDDLLESLREAVSQAGIRNGMIVNGVGSLSRYRVHVVNKPSLPTEDVFFEGDGPYDILSITGLILDGRVHAHIAFSNTDRAMGGHLEEGCRILTFAMIVLADTPDAEIAEWDTVGHM